MVLLLANPLLGPLEGEGPQNLVAVSGPKKVVIIRAHPCNDARNGFAPIKIITARAIYKQQLH